MSQSTVSKPIKITYWTVTILLSALLLMAAVNHLSLSTDVIAMTQHLGFPLGLLPFLGIMKILGVITILFVRRGDVTIGAYAGILFYGLGAMATHISVGDPIATTAGGFIITTFSLASYFLWKRVNQPTYVKNARKHNAHAQRHHAYA